MIATLSTHASTRQQELEEAFKSRYHSLLPLLKNSGLAYRLVPGPQPESNDSVLVVYRHLSAIEKQHRCQFTIQEDGTVTTKSYGSFSPENLATYLAAFAAEWERLERKAEWNRRNYPLNVFNKITAILFVAALIFAACGAFAEAMTPGNTSPLVPVPTLLGSGILLGGLAIWSKRRLNRSEAAEFPDQVAA